MLKAYVCEYCLGRGNTWLFYDQEKPDNSEWGPCPECAGKGLPPKIEVSHSGPPAAKEMVIETTLSEVTPPVLEEQK